MAIADALFHPSLSTAYNAGLLTVSRSIVSPVCGFTNAAQNMFTVSGAPVRARITGVVSVSVGGTAMNGTLQHTTVAPASTAQLSTAVSLASKAAGTSIRFVGLSTQAVLTPLTAGSTYVDPVTTDDIWFLLTVGALTFLATAINTGNIIWYMEYVPLSSDSVVSVT